MLSPSRPIILYYNMQMGSLPPPRILYRTVGILHNIIIKSCVYTITTLRNNRPTVFRVQREELIRFVTTAGKV